MPTRIERLTAEQTARFPEWVAKYTGLQLTTEPCDRPRAEAAIRGLYRAAHLEEPLVIVWVPSPLVMAFAGCFASVLWRLAESGCHWNATENATENATQDETGLTKALLEHCRCWDAYRDMGNLWSYGFSHLTFLRDVAHLELEEWDQFAHYEQAAVFGGPRMMHKRFCIVSERPTQLRTYIRDGRHVPHCEDGPSHLWDDGWALWYLDGVQVDQQIVLHPETQTVEQITSEPNEEVKRVRTERYGWKRYLTEVGATVLDRRRNDIEATRESLMRAPDGATVLVCACPSTARTYALEVPTGIQTCEQAQHWRSGGLSRRIINAS
jgi:hypothetical protein